MKQKFYTFGLSFLVMLSTCILTGCSDDKKSHSAAVDMSSWPDDLPKFKDGKLFSIFNDEDTGVFGGAVFSQTKNPETAYKNYITALINKGWVLDDDDDRSNEYGWIVDYIKEPKSVNVNVQRDGSFVQILYSAD